MKKVMVSVVMIAFAMYAAPVYADGCTKCEPCAQCAPCAPAKPCPKCPAKSMFQWMGDSIRCCNPKPWLLSPMNPLGPVAKEKMMGFQKIADSIERCPAKPKSCCPAKAKNSCPRCGR